MESTGLWIALSILTLVLAIVIGLYIFRELGYRDLINNESKLCLSHNCAYSTPECGALPFKIGSDGTPTCAPPNIFTNSFANGNVPNPG
jgi:hypothetical protein